MVLSEFPDLTWLKQQINSRFENRTGVNGRILKEKGWPTVLLNVKTSGVFRDNIKGPFSLFGNMEGSSLVSVDKRIQKVNKDHFFITNSGQNYTLEIDQRSTAETFNIHFGDHFADQLIQSQSGSIDRTIDNPFNKPLKSFLFHNRLIRKSERVTILIQLLRENKNEMREEELLTEFFLELFQDELTLAKKIETIPSVKKSTREELIKRILLSADYIHEFYNQELSLEELGAVSCLSKFHFLRLFKIAMGKTPHQFINQLRIDKSKELLTKTKTEIKQIADFVGFPDSSSFSRAFYLQVGTYPSQFRSLT